MPGMEEGREQYVYFSYYIIVLLCVEFRPSLKLNGSVSHFVGASTEQIIHCFLFIGERHTFSKLFIKLGPMYISANFLHCVLWKAVSIAFNENVPHDNFHIVQGIK